MSRLQLTCPRPPVQVLCWLVEPVSAVVQSLSSSALTDLLQQLQGGEGQLSAVLQNKVNKCTAGMFWGGTGPISWFWFWFQFAVTLLYLILSEGERMQSADPNCQLMDDNRW